MSAEHGVTETQVQVVRTLDNRAEQAYETAIIDLLYDLEDGCPVNNFYIDQSTHAHTAEQNAATEQRINLLCQNLGVNPQSFSSVFMSGGFGNGHWSNREVSVRDIKGAERRGVSIGRVLMTYANMAFPIEYDEQGDSTVDLKFHCEGPHELHLQALGSFWTGRPDEDLEADDSMSSDCEIRWRLDYKADISPAS